MECLPLPRGNRSIDVQFAPHHAHGRREGKLVGIFVGFEGGFVLQTANDEVDHHGAAEFLSHQVGGFAAQCDPGAAQMALEFGERSFYLPAFAMEGNQFVNKSPAGRIIITA